MEYTALLNAAQAKSQKPSSSRLPSPSFSGQNSTAPSPEDAFKRVLDDAGGPGAGVEEGIEGESGEVFDAYVCRGLPENVLSKTKRHPTDVVEPFTLATVSLPKVYYPLLESLGPYVESGALSE